MVCGDLFILNRVCLFSTVIYLVANVYVVCLRETAPTAQLMAGADTFTPARSRVVGEKGPPPPPPSAALTLTSPASTGPGTAAMSLRTLAPLATDSRGKRKAAEADADDSMEESTPAHLPFASTGSAAAAPLSVTTPIVTTFEKRAKASSTTTPTAVALTATHGAASAVAPISASESKVFTLSGYGKKERKDQKAQMIASITSMGGTIFQGTYDPSDDKHQLRVIGPADIQWPYRSVTSFHSRVLSKCI
jgi:hypothetical protein